MVAGGQQVFWSLFDRRYVMVTAESLIAFSRRGGGVAMWILGSLSIMEATQLAEGHLAVYTDGLLYDHGYKAALLYITPL